MEGADGGWLWWWGVGGDGFVPAEEGGEGEAAGEEHCCLLFGPGEGCCLLLKFLSCPWWLWSAFVRLVCREVQVSRRGNFGVAATSSVFLGAQDNSDGASPCVLYRLQRYKYGYIPPIIQTSQTADTDRAQRARYTATSLIREPHQQA